jgi:hypothetical protein
MDEFTGTKGASNSQFVAEALLDLYPRLPESDQVRYAAAYQAAAIEMENFE